MGEGSLEETIPGIPGEDYPIFGQVPESSFLCDGQVDGGYYADTEAECQAFHICGSDGNGGLTKYSFLCPNGTLFNQQYFVCDWWLNVDCSLAESLYSLNADVAAAAAAATAEGGAGRRSRKFEDGNVPVVDSFSGNSQQTSGGRQNRRRPSQ